MTLSPDDDDGAGDGVADTDTVSQFRSDRTTDRYRNVCDPATDDPYQEMAEQVQATQRIVEEWLSQGDDDSTSDVDAMLPDIVKGINDDNLVAMIRQGRINIRDSEVGTKKTLFGWLQNAILLHDLNYKEKIKGKQWDYYANKITGLGRKANQNLVKLYPFLMEGDIKNWIEVEIKKCRIKNLPYGYPTWQDCVAYFMPVAKDTPPPPEDSPSPKTGEDSEEAAPDDPEELATRLAEAREQAAQARDEAARLRAELLATRQPPPPTAGAATAPPIGSLPPDHVVLDDVALDDVVEAVLKPGWTPPPPPQKPSDSQVRDTNHAAADADIVQERDSLRRRCEMLLAENAALKAELLEHPSEEPVTKPLSKSQYDALVLVRDHPDRWPDVPPRTKGYIVDQGWVLVVDAGLPCLTESGRAKLGADRE